VRFLRYFCMYCASRLIFESVRGALRRQHNHKPASPVCNHGARGWLLMLLSLPFVFLALMGFLGFLISK
jgi:hypothetical protein